MDKIHWVWWNAPKRFRGDWKICSEGVAFSNEWGGSGNFRLKTSLITNFLGSQHHFSFNVYFMPIEFFSNLRINKVVVVKIVRRFPWLFSFIQFLLLHIYPFRLIGQYQKLHIVDFVLSNFVVSEITLLKLRVLESSLPNAAFMVHSGTILDWTHTLTGDVPRSFCISRRSKNVSEVGR